MTVTSHREADTPTTLGELDTRRRYLLPDSEDPLKLLCFVAAQTLDPLLPDVRNPNASRRQAPISFADRACPSQRIAQCVLHELGLVLQIAQSVRQVSIESKRHAGLHVQHFAVHQKSPQGDLIFIQCFRYLRTARQPPLRRVAQSPRRLVRRDLGPKDRSPPSARARDANLAARSGGVHAHCSHFGNAPLCDHRSSLGPRLAADRRGAAQPSVSSSLVLPSG